MDASAEDLEEREAAVDVGPQGDRRRRAARASRCSTRSTACAPGARAALQAARPGAVLVSALDRRGPATTCAAAVAARLELAPAQRAAALPRPATRAASPASTRAGAWSSPRGGGRRGDARGRDPGAAPRAVPGAPGLKRAAASAAWRSLAAAARWRWRRACADARAAPAQPPEAEDYVVSPGSAAGELRRGRGAQASSGPGSDVLAGNAAARREARSASCCATTRAWCPRRPGSPTRACARGGRRTRPRRLRVASSRGRPDVRAGAGRRRLPRRCAPGDPEAALRTLRRAAGRRHRRRPTVRRRLSERASSRSRSVAWRRRARPLGAGNAERGDRGVPAAPSTRRRRWRALRLELADLLVRARRRPRRPRAVLEADPAGDRQVLLRLGELLARPAATTRGALEAYRRDPARDPRDAEALRRARAAREALELLADARGVPAHPVARRASRAPTWPRSSRARSRALAAPAGAEPEVAVDISGSWAREHILQARCPSTSWTVYPNHTFQPGRDRAPRRPGPGRGARPRPAAHPAGPGARRLSDMTPSNLYYDAAGARRGGGPHGPDRRRAPSRPGGRSPAARPSDVIEALARLVGP